MLKLYFWNPVGIWEPEAGMDHLVLPFLFPHGKGWAGSGFPKSCQGRESEDLQISWADPLPSAPLTRHQALGTGWWPEGVYTRVCARACMCTATCMGVHMCVMGGEGWEAGSLLYLPWPPSCIKEMKGLPNFQCKALHKIKSGLQTNYRKSAGK